METAETNQEEGSLAVMSVVSVASTMSSVSSVVSVLSVTVSSVMSVSTMMALSASMVSSSLILTLEWLDLLLILWSNLSLGFISLVALKEIKEVLESGFFLLLIHGVDVAALENSWWELFGHGWVSASSLNGSRFAPRALVSVASVLR